MKQGIRWSGVRESNPRLQLGRLGSYHYTNAAIRTIEIYIILGWYIPKTFANWKYLVRERVKGYLACLHKYFSKMNACSLICEFTFRLRAEAAANRQCLWDWLARFAGKLEGYAWCLFWVTYFHSISFFDLAFLFFKDTYNDLTIIGWV